MSNPIEDMLRRDRFAARSSITLEELAPGRARTRMAAGPEHLNGVGVVQGGAIFTLADLAFAAAVNSHGVVALAVSASIQFVKAAREGVLVAEAVEVARTTRTAACEVRVTDASGDLVALFTGTAYRTSKQVGDAPAS